MPALAGRDPPRSANRLAAWPVAGWLRARRATAREQNTWHRVVGRRGGKWRRARLFSPSSELGGVTRRATVLYWCSSPARRSGGLDAGMCCGDRSLIEAMRVAGCRLYVHVCGRGGRQGWALTGVGWCWGRTLGWGECRAGCGGSALCSTSRSRVDLRIFSRSLSSSCLPYAPPCSGALDLVGSASPATLGITIVARVGNAAL